MNNHILFFALFVLQVGTSLGQVMETASIIPPAPEAASLGTVNDIDVDLYSGKANVSIPLFNVAGTSMSVPVSLSYTGSGGIKVEEIASRVGIGWALNAGGSITRTIKGLADDHLSYGYFDHGEDLLAASNSTVNNEIKETYEDIINYYLDAQPDDYHLSSPSASFKFLVGQDESCHPIPFSNEAISFDRDPVFGHIIRWRVTDTQGTTYIYGTSRDETRAAIDTVYILGNSAYNPVYPPPLYSLNGWHLVEIIGINREVVDLFYANYSSSYCRRISSHTYLPSITTNYQNGFQTKQSMTSHDQWSSVESQGTVLERIESENQTLVILQRDVERLDLPVSSSNFKGHHTNRAVKAIVLLGAEGDTIQKVTFSTSYFNGNGVSPSGLAGYCDDGGTTQYRLKLDGIQQSAGLVEVPPYLFTYANSLPDRLSYDQDHWGYYNAAGNSTLVPTWRLGSTQGNIVLDGADRSPKLTNAKGCILESITYPTGGVVEIEYELNTVWSNTEEYEFPDLDSIYAQVKASDLTSSIVTLTDDFTINGPCGNSGCGVLMKIVIGSNSSVSCDASLPASTSNQQACGTSITVDGGNVIAQNASLNFLDRYTFLGNGSHQLKLNAIELSDAQAADLMCTIWGPKKINTQIRNKPVGGVRVKTVIRRDPTGDNSIPYTTSYQYHDPYYQSNGVLKSSGVLVNKPNYLATYGINYFEYVSSQSAIIPIYAHLNPTSGVISILGGGAIQGQGSAVPYKDMYVDISSASNLPLASGSGGHIGYEYVTVEKRDANGVRLGKEEYEFYDPNDFPDLLTTINVDGFPKPWPTSVSWRRGLLRNKKVYSIENHGLSLVSSTSNEYEFNNGNSSPNQKEIGGIVASCYERETPQSGTVCTITDCCADIRFSYYTTLSEWPYLQTSSEKVYNKTDSTKYLETVSTFYHGNPAHGLMTHSERTDGHGNLVKEYVKYTDDYAADTTSIGSGSNEAGKAIRMLLRRKATGVLIEKYQIQEDGSQDYIVGGMINEPNLYRSDSIVGLGNVLLLDPGQAGQSSFVPSNINGSGNFTYDSNWGGPLTIRT